MSHLVKFRCLETDLFATLVATFTSGTDKIEERSVDYESCHKIQTALNQASFIGPPGQHLELESAVACPVSDEQLAYLRLTPPR